MKSNKVSILLAVIALIISTLACGSSGPPGVSNIYMASDDAGNNKTTTFAPTDTIHVFFDVNQVDNGAQLQMKWFALNVDGQDPTTSFKTLDYAYKGEPTINGQISSTSGGFPVGQYKVEVYLNDAKVGEQQFDIK
jgi:hypothetical protein